MIITRLAPAKINLMLHVVGRLADGYHHLQSLVAFADAGDQLTFEKADAFHLTVGGPFGDQVPLTSDNSVARAAQWLGKKYPGIERMHIHLIKKLPVASGMGGGSSDAAATMAALLHGFSVSLSRPDEEALILASGELGADVPMCLAHQFGWGPLLWIDSSGRETLPVPVNVSLPGVLVLVNPGVPVSTSAIFKNIHPPYTPPQDLRSVLERDFQEGLLPYLMAQKNGLMEPAINQEPQIGEVIAALQRVPGCRLARMSGSGATCFALFEDKVCAKNACAAFNHTWPQGWSMVCALYPSRKI